MVPGFWKPKVRVGIKFNECVLLAETQTLHGAFLIHVHTSNLNKNICQRVP